MKSNALEIYNKGNLLKIHLLVLFGERFGAGRDNSNVEFQNQIAPCCPDVPFKPKNRTASPQQGFLSTTRHSQIPAGGLHPKPEALSHTLVWVRTKCSRYFKMHVFKNDSLA